MKRPIAFVVLFAVSALVFVQTNRVCADVVHVVSPSAYTDAESSGSVTAPNSNGRYQQIYPASDFQSLPDGIRTITEFAYRPDGNLTTPLQGSYGTLTVKLSTTSVEPGSLSLTFADNIGADETTVFIGTDVDSSTQNLGRTGGPKVFDMIIPFQSPFVYDPSQGNLLMEVFFTYQGDFSTDWVTTAGTSGEFIGGDIGDTTAFFSGAGGFVTQFTVVPEPSTLTLFSMFGMVGAFVAWRKRKRT